MTVATRACGPLTIADLLDLDAYVRERTALRARVIGHKRDRTVRVGPNMTWIFEDRLTIQYQVQEMLRVERLTEPVDIQAELDTCAIADEDLERENAEKTSAVHWLRFELPPPARAAARAGAPVTVGVDHPRYRHELRLLPATVHALARELR